MKTIIDMTIFQAVRDLKNDDELLYFLCNEIEMKQNHQELMKKEYYTLYEDISSMINGRAPKQCNVLHVALTLEKSLAVVLKLIEIGGRELVIEKDGEGATSLHLACIHNASVEVVSKLIEIGGKEIVMERESFYNTTALHCACINSSPIEVISKLVEIGGKELVMEKMESLDQQTALHLICNCNDTPIEVVSKLADIGGKELIMKKNGRDGSTSLHYACRGEGSIEVVSKLIEIGEKEIITERDNYGQSALYYGYFSDESSNIFNDCFVHMLKEGILAQLGGEFGIGGIFNCVNTDDEQKRIFHQWESFGPFLKTAMTSIHQQYHIQVPILHAAIIAKAPQHIIKDIIDRFDCILAIDSFNRYPVNVAVDEGLEWHEGMREIISATSIAKKCPIINIAAQYGLKWNNHMGELAESVSHQVPHARDNKTGLQLFMLAAMGCDSDLTSIYGMRRMSPQP